MEWNPESKTVLDSLISYKGRIVFAIILYQTSNFT